MRKIFTSVLIIFCWSYVNAATKHIVKVPGTIVKFINCVEKLSDFVDEETAIRLRSEMTNCFASQQETYGINIDDGESGNSSEFPFLGLATVSNSTSYCMRLYTYIFTNKSLKISHQVLNTETINIVGDDGKNELYFYSTTLKKTCSYNNTTINLWQVIEVPSGHNKPIDQLVTYEYEPKATSIVDAYEEKIGIPNINESKNQHKQEEPQRRELSEREYLNLAARYYTAKNYERSYDVLKKMTEIYDMNAEGWYRLALIVYYQPQSCKKIYSNHKEAAKSFMKNAEARASGTFKERISNRLLRWELRKFM